ncbi:MAG TPA: hypothetical protein VJY65_04820 [Chloroflexota bacterium]|nr:hypothetical protein [Chloroflexota bacterium]
MRKRSGMLSTHEQPHCGNILCAHPPLHSLLEGSKDGLSLVQVQSQAARQLQRQAHVFVLVGNGEAGRVVARDYLLPLALHLLFGLLLASLVTGVALVAMAIKLAPVLALGLVLYWIVTRRRTLRSER